MLRIQLSTCYNTHKYMNALWKYKYKYKKKKHAKKLHAFENEKLSLKRNGFM